ncbi:MAG: imidazoleglycerol-phosphate dehydratase HisB [Acidimicrobiia bacterium]|nr:imidazoleglycerol-phosphate dehydratase HisB [Acidimicrobiia bacterium]MDH3397441.1 imidazoleglycerol-phosphate dehydratase HisB [Acidimicrobiia bacterium]MDH5615813.1 imidazoleglycerol-phosphate dehydratase HisB [Acidimicrobiia bacterium]
MSRAARVERTTRETRVDLRLELDGSGIAEVATGVGFFDHLLTSLSHHGLFDLLVTTEGDLEIDDHHTVEDTALVLGQAFAEALGDRAGIVRFADATVPMDEALATAVVDVGGRPYTVLDLSFSSDRIGALSTEMIPHALEALARTAGFTLHLTSRGRNDHHVAEAAFKALARALRNAVADDSRREGIPSTKGTM